MAPGRGRAAAGSSTIGASVPSKSQRMAARSGRAVRGARSPDMRRRYPRPVRRLLLGACGAVVLLGACKPGAVRVDFRPRSGSTYTYAIDVQAQTMTAIDGRAPSRSESDEHLQAHHVVQAIEGGGVVVDVKVTGSGVPERTFEVTLDRAASLVAVQRVEDIPASVLGDLGLSEVFPAAAGAPPDRKLRPGATWKIDEPVTLPGTLAVRLTGSGRLVQLGVVDGRQVATIKSSYRLPVHQTSQ